MNIIFYNPSMQIPESFKKVEIQPIVDKDYIYQLAQPIKMNFAYDLRSGRSFYIASPKRSLD